MARLCTICARGGSKGVPGKNLRMLAGRPLIAHSIAQAHATGLFAAVAVSSDDAAILEAARAAGADLLIERPAEMASDTAAKAPAIRHAVASAEARLGTMFEVLVDLDATSPLRLPEDVIGAVRLLEDDPTADNVITAAPARHPPYFNLVELDPNGIARLSKTLPGGVVRRQDAPPCFDMNGSVYVWRREPFMTEPYVFGEHTRLFVMPRERSVDIDDEVDFLLVELLMARQHPGQGAA